MDYYKIWYWRELHCLSVHFVYPCFCLAVVLQSAVAEGFISYLYSHFRSQSVVG
jgi:hypothetical protein